MTTNVKNQNTVTKSEALRKRLKEYLKDPQYDAYAVQNWGESLNQESDRAVVLLMGAMAHEVLKALVTDRMVNLNSDLKTRLFGPEAPLSSFASLSHLAYAAGWISKADYSSLSILREMRNACAHSIKTMTFSIPRCLVPANPGTVLSIAARDALWDRYFTAAPRRRRLSVAQYKIVKRA